MSGLPQGWVEGLAGELCDVVGGATPRTDTPEFWGGEIPWLTPDDLSRDRSQYIHQGRRNLTKAGLASCAASMVPVGTVLFTSRAPIGYAAIATREVATNQGFKSLVPSHALSSEFLYWQLRYLTDEIRAMGSGTTFKEVSKKVVAGVRLLVAPLPEQARIVAAIEEAFSKLDAGEAGLRSVRQRLKRMREAVLNAAVTGRLVPRAPGAGSDELPPSWTMTTLESIAEVRLGRQRSPERATGPRMRPYLRAANVGWAGLRLDDVKEMAFTEAESKAYELLPGDILLSEASGSPGEVGKPAQYRGEVPGCCFQNTLIRVRLKPGLSPDYFELSLRNDALRGRFARGARGVGIHHLGRQALAEWPVAVPPLAEQHRIVAEVERQLSFIDACERTVDAGLARAAALRRSILKAAFEGRLVPQDPSDEPASVLLARIRAERSAAPASKRPGRRSK